ncbi:hypothetical protein N5P37_011547 [Trichoderma harzianum]|uniref:Transcription factor domain-containing protein n=1 Tax=Trichoderma harzianum CBS 226.95 TaxID=983964 RepID=A0A2T3ZT02_TRIHA|nr:hypothetical protein M431DRAFT_11354 [Trichoderma harzianum CBS 226.95]KAK0755871.1 hypothetical protein N5P37_011547 [Trichoderma harzianum]PTB47934.1 hypothetical protein M431DRAFT_11354 [Trichoderma harzianum CBS 226.95]
MDPKESDDSGPSSNLLFINSTESARGKPRDSQTKRQIRQHVMRDIGKARRKPPRNPQVKLRVRSAEPAAEPSSSASSLTAPTNTGATDPGESQLIPLLQPEQQQSQYGKEPQPLPPLARPFWDQHPLAVMQNSWGMDAFAAYGLALAASWDCVRNPRRRRFWFPFAFKDPGFCRKLLTGPEVRAAVRSQTMERSITFALARSTEVVACIESKLRDPDPNMAVANNVLRGVMGCICYNYIVGDLDQARVHLNGLRLLINRRGGIDKLSDDQDLVMMVFWIDTIASLLFEQRPWFPMPSRLPPISTLPLHDSPDILSALPFHLSSLCPDLNAHQLCVVSALQDIASLAGAVQWKLAARGEDLWKEEIFLGTRLNPIAYRLMDTPPHPHPDMPCIFIETLRLGALLWILQVKNMAQAYPGTPATYVTKLLHLLQNHSIENLVSASSYYIPFQLWLLLLCATMSEVPSEKANALETVSRRMNEYGWEWEEMMTNVKQLPWIPGFEAHAPTIATQVQLLRSMI